MKLLISTVFLISMVSCATSQKKVNQDIKPKDTEVYLTIPKITPPANCHAHPSDAILLFDGINLDQWQSTDGSSAKWIIKDGYMEVLPQSGAIQTVSGYGSCQLHIEWLAPVQQNKEGQQYSNSGVFFMGQYEVQILNSYENTTYSNGQASSIYKQYAPLVNASTPPGTWQTYDIIFNAPQFDDNGDVTKKAVITVFHNGVLTQNHAVLEGPTIYQGYPLYKAHAPEMPLMLQDHGDPMRFRNIWIRKI